MTNTHSKLKFSANEIRIIEDALRIAIKDYHKLLTIDSIQYAANENEATALLARMALIK